MSAAVPGDDASVPRPAARALHVAMAVANDIEQDARVRKTALALADAGHRVTLLHVVTGRSRDKVGSLGPVTTVGLPVPYVLRDALAEGHVVRTGLAPGSYASDTELALDQGAAALRSLRSAHAGPAARARAAAAAATVRLRTRLHEAHRERAERGREDGAEDAPRPWREVLPNVGDLDLTFARRLWRLDPDVLHVHDIHLLEAGVIALRRLRAQGRSVSLVYDAHEFVPGMAARDAVAAQAWSAMERELIGSVDAVVTVSEPIADALRREYRLPERPTVTLNSPRLADLEPTDADVRTAAGLAPEVPLLVYSGVINPRRGVLTAVDALAHLPGVHLAVVSVPHAATPAAKVLTDHAREIGVTDRVHVVDPVATEQIVSFLSTADAGVHPMMGGLPNHEMALPNKLFDYLFAGLPVLVSDVREMARFVGEHKVGETFRPLDAADLARAAQTVLSSPGAYREHAADPALRAQVSWEAQAQGLADLYARLATRVAGRTAPRRSPGPVRRLLRRSAAGS